jgi:2'-hydroxyisoflavone reductase
MKETRDSLIASQFKLYGPLKALSEAEAEKWFPGKTLVIRPGLIVGPGDQTDRFTYWPVRIDRRWRAASAWRSQGSGAVHRCA